MDKYVITNSCVRCGECACHCPSGAIYPGDNKFNISGNCIGCGDCVNRCPVNAIVKR